MFINSPFLYIWFLHLTWLQSQIIINVLCLSDEGVSVDWTQMRWQQVSRAVELASSRDQRVICFEQAYLTWCDVFSKLLVTPATDKERSKSYMPSDFRVYAVRKNMEVSQFSSLVYEESYLKISLKYGKKYHHEMTWCRHCLLTRHFIVSLCV